MASAEVGLRVGNWNLANLPSEVRTRAVRQRPAHRTASAGIDDESAQAPRPITGGAGRYRVLGIARQPCSCGACRAGDECGDDVGGVSVEAASGPVVAHRCSRVGVAGGFLDVSQRDTGVEGGGDE